MAQDSTKKEALFNEVKGSLFEYLVARELSVAAREEASFIKSIDPNYLNVLSQQDRMVRQFYPEMFPFLQKASKKAAETLQGYLKESPSSVRVVGKFSNTESLEDLHEADLILSLKEKKLPVSLKLNKKNAYVNTKSGGIKSFFSQYFSFMPASYQQEFNAFVDREFSRMSHELHELHDMEYTGSFGEWVRKGFSELPGELDPDSRLVLKRYYARIASEMHRILTEAKELDAEKFRNSLPALLGFSSSEILQVIFFHDFPHSENHEIEIHSYHDLRSSLEKADLLPFNDTSSSELLIGDWSLQVRVKPMNKFTTTAIKINCSVKVKRPSSF